MMAKKPWPEIAKVLSNLRENPEDVRRMILSYATSKLLDGDNADAYSMAECFRNPFFDKHTAKADFVFACYVARISMDAGNNNGETKIPALSKNHPFT